MSDNCVGIPPNKSVRIYLFKTLQDTLWRNQSSFDNQAERQSGANEAAWQDRRAAPHWHLLPNFKASFEVPERRSAPSPGNTHPLHSPLLANVLRVEGWENAKSGSKRAGQRSSAVNRSASF